MNSFSSFLSVPFFLCFRLIFFLVQLFFRFVFLSICSFAVLVVTRGETFLFFTPKLHICGFCSFSLMCSLSLYTEGSFAGWRNDLIFAVFDHFLVVVYWFSITKKQVQIHFCFECQTDLLLYIFGKSIE